ncbi:MAG: protein-L-isoaspartate(D-aspartate) O-methyltransferase [Herpetosiphonaceae bacterium]|nr:protein-L-isoaspartate(D-aspartate) O-methyltransferase [Herpetosiphonaceae bacterium]
MNERQSERSEMVAAQLRSRGIRNERVLAAMHAIPRHRFVLNEYDEAAYADQALPISCTQTISQPFVVARMAEALRLQPSDRVLEVGTGSGYAAAVLSQLAAAVYTLERHHELAAAAVAHFEQLALRNISVGVGDGTAGWPAYAPYDAMSVAAAGPQIPAALRDQLALGGRLVMPVGERSEQHLLLLERLSNGDQLYDLGTVRFVPLIGTAGWKD